MTLWFPYLEEAIQGLPPPSLPQTAQSRWRPLVPITVHGLAGTLLSFGRALMDPGADDTIFPLDAAALLGISLLPSTGHSMRWRGQRHFLRFGAVDLELADEFGNAIRWPPTVAFTAAYVRYPLLGMCGCLEYLDVKFLGKVRAIEIEPNDSMPSTAHP